ncbi:MAG TPA: prolipoprotein diacylglyceryl transferase family protein [Symbiobacteriaceae bacterium]|jgi:hypothetical protein
MNFLPDVIQLGSFPIDIRTLMGLLGLVLAYLVAGLLPGGLSPAGAREGAQDLVLDLAIGGILGAKLLDVALNPAGYLANPLALLVFPFGPLALPAGLVGGAVAVARSLWRRPDRLAVLDATAVPLALGLALDALGFRGPGAGAFASLLGVAALAALTTVRLVLPPGHRAAFTTVLVACALALADIARPGVSLVGGVSGLQLAAALAGTCAWLWTRRKST